VKTNVHKIAFNMNDVIEQKIGPAAAIDAGWLATRLPGKSIRDIVLGVGALIRAGELPAGSRLPTVRDLAWKLGVSPATISTAWLKLRQHRIIGGRGRNGMWINAESAIPRPERFAELGDYGPDFIDLSLAVPDPALLPPLGEALTQATAAAELNSYRRQPIVAALERAARADWPYRAESFMATNGGFEAIQIALSTLIMPGSIVAVEDPTALRMLDILEQIGAQILPVPCDAQGPRADALAEALKRNPAAFVFQPRTNSISGCGVTAGRLRELAKLLRGRDMLILENDGLGDIAGRPPASLGDALPGVVHVRSYSKSLGPDMRIAVLSGPARAIARMQAFRNFGAGWTSRILQHAAAWLIVDKATRKRIDRACEIYATRRRALIAALAKRDIKLRDEDGLSLWVPVHAEAFAMLTLAARRIKVAPGSKFGAAPEAHVRVATSMLLQDVDAVADALAIAAAGIGGTPIDGFGSDY